MKIRIGVSEKGFVNVEMEVRGVAQHSSFPPEESPIGILGRAVARLEDKQQPIVFGQGPEGALFEHVAPDVRKKNVFFSSTF
jgi:carboxypeptidase PM20D1